MASPERLRLDMPDNEDTQTSLLDPPYPETQSLLFHQSYIPSQEPHSSHPLVLFLCVVLPALAGFSFYFLSDLQEKSSTQRADLSGIAPKTILISIDAFRYDYLSRKKNGSDEYLAPTLHRIANSGARAHGGMQPVMPTKTFSNHWSIVTGLYPESHGIISNTMYNPISKKWFHTSNSDRKWWGGTPVWKTLRDTSSSNAGKVNSTGAPHNYTTACVFWPGSNVQGLLPNAYWEWDPSKSYGQRVQRVLDLLSGQAHDIKERVDFVTLYFNLVDTIGHTKGPNSPEMDVEIERADRAISKLISGLGEDAIDKYNIIIVSDHGMTEISSDRVVDLSASMPVGSVQDIRVSPLGLWENMTVSAEKVARDIREVIKHNKHAAVYLKDDVPERWHIKHSPFITPIVTMAELGWTVLYPHQHLVPGTHDPLRMLKTDVREAWSQMVVVNKGEHGYDNEEEDMQAIFLAQGPAFRNKSVVKNMRAIDVYEMICYIFGAQPSPNNGSLDVTLKSILKV